MRSKSLQCLLLLSVALSFSYEAFCEASYYNCKTYAVEQTVSSVTLTYSFVRQWSELGGTYDESTQTWTGEWMDKDTTGELTNQLGCCWLSVTLEKGKDYVIGVPVSDGCYLAKSVKFPNEIYTKFSQVQSGGIQYHYIRATDWVGVDAATVGFYLNYNGGLGSIGKTFTFYFNQISIDDVLPQIPGMKVSPIELDVLSDGTATIATSVEKTYNRKSVAYSAALKAGERYTFKASSPSSEYGLYFTLKDALEWDKIPGTYDNDVNGTFVITVTTDYTLVLLVIPDDEHWDTGDPSGGTISWQLGADPVPQPTYAGVFEGSLTDVDYAEKTASFSVAVKLMDNGQTNFNATVTAGDITISLYDDGTGNAVTGRTVIAGIHYPQSLELALKDGKCLSVDGALFFPFDVGAQEYFFQGTLGGSPVAWNDCFLKYSPQTSSAVEMGITSGAFAGEAAGSATLIKVHAWGASKNVAISSVNTATFAANGDPSSVVAEAYLLDCAATEEAVAAAAAAFVIESFDPATGEVVMRGGAAGGDDYGNGRIEVRTSASPAGPYDTTDKGSTENLFSKAYLVK